MFFFLGFNVIKLRNNNMYSACLCYKQKKITQVLDFSDAYLSYKLDQQYITSLRRIIILSLRKFLPRSPSYYYLAYLIM